MLYDHMLKGQIGEAVLKKRLFQCDALISIAFIDRERSITNIILAPVSWALSSWLKGTLGPANAIEKNTQAKM